MFEYDEDQKDGHQAFTAMLVMLGRMIIDNPEVVGTRSDIHGLGLGFDSSRDTPGSSAAQPGSAGYLDLGFSVMSSAASAGVNTVSAMMAGESHELGTACAPKTQW